MHKHSIQKYGPPLGILFLTAFTMIFFSSASDGRASGESAEELFKRGLSAEARLDLFGAREDFRKAIEIDPNLMGLLEHTAWFLYLNGFHNPECLRLFEECLPRSSDPNAVRQAIRKLRLFRHGSSMRGRLFGLVRRKTLGP